MRRQSWRLESNLHLDYSLDRLCSIPSRRDHFADILALETYSASLESCPLKHMWYSIAWYHFSGIIFWVQSTPIFIVLLRYVIEVFVFCYGCTFYFYKVRLDNFEIKLFKILKNSKVPAKLNIHQHRHI